MPVLQYHDQFDDACDKEYESSKLGDRSIVSGKYGVYEYKFKDDIWMKLAGKATTLVNFI